MGELVNLSGECSSSTAGLATSARRLSTWWGVGVRLIVKLGDCGPLRPTPERPVGCERTKRYSGPAGKVHSRPPQLDNRRGYRQYDDS